MTEKGFSLVEVLIAISVLAIGILAVASIQGYAIRASSSANAVSYASVLAADRLEKLLALSHDDPLLEDKDGDGSSGLDDTGFDNNPDTIADADFADLNQLHGGRAFHIYWNIAPDTPVQGAKTLKVIVVWNEKNSSKSISIIQIL